MHLRRRLLKLIDIQEIFDAIIDVALNLVFKLQLWELNLEDI